MGLENFVHTRITGDAIPLKYGQEATEKVARLFLDVINAERLARLVIDVLGERSEPSLSRNDFLSLLSNKYVAYTNADKEQWQTTELGLIAINLIRVDFFDGSDFDMSLQEPFVEIDVLEKVQMKIAQNPSNIM